jgi:arginyl-tRNA synthetase
MAMTILNAVPKAERTGATLGRYYAESTKLLDENPDWKTQVSQVQRNLEAHLPGWQVIWHETRRWSLDEMSQIFDDLGVTLSRQYFESEVVDEGQKMVDELLEKSVARVSQGAVVVDLEEEKLGVFLIRKSDGTSLYATKDLALAKKKFEEYPNLSRCLIMVDHRQSLYFKQLFKTLELMKIGKPQEFIGYEFVTLKSGAMSSREGNVVAFQDFRNEVMAHTAKETKSRHPEWPKGRLEHTSWALAMGGMKYGMLKQDSDKLYTFDLERALAFDGDTGPYIQYAATRLGAILKKAKWDPEEGIEAGNLSLLNDLAEKRLALQIAAFPSVCRRAARELKPAILAQWCFLMAQEITHFYHDVNVLESEFGVKQARLRLIAAVQTVLIQGLDLLGIPMPDEM